MRGEGRNRSTVCAQLDMTRSQYRGTSLLRNASPPPRVHRRVLGIVPLWGPREGRFLLSEVPLYKPVDLGAKKNPGFSAWQTLGKPQIGKP